MPMSAQRQQEPTVAHPPSEFSGPLLSDLPPDVIETLLQRLSSREIARAIPASREIAAVGSDILRRREERTRTTLCPTEVSCRGSLLCAILADDDEAMRRIIFPTQCHAPGAQSVCNIQLLPPDGKRALPYITFRRRSRSGRRSNLGLLHCGLPRFISSGMPSSPWGNSCG